MHRIALLALIALGCGSEEERVQPIAAEPSSASLEDWLPPGHPTGTSRAHGGALPPGHPPIEGHDMAGTAEPPPDAIQGTVTETMNSGGYTYMQLETDDGPVWIAGTQREIAVGDRVTASGSVMHDFHSNTLDRTFDRLVLASDVRVEHPN